MDRTTQTTSRVAATLIALFALVASACNDPGEAADAPGAVDVVTQVAGTSIPAPGVTLAGGTHTSSIDECTSTECAVLHEVRFGTDADPGGSIVFVSTVDTAALFDERTATVDCGNHRYPGAGDDISTATNHTVMFSLPEFGSGGGTTTDVHVTQVDGAVACIDVYGTWNAIEGESAGGTGDWHLSTQADGSVAITFTDRVART